MSPMSAWNGKLTVPNALLLGHDEARADFLRATMEGGRIGKAGKRLAQLCLPHFEHEEEIVFPVLALVPHLEGGTLGPETADVETLIANFRARHDALDGHHHLIASAIDDLLQAARRESNREFVELAQNLRVHERIEDEVIYPRAVLIGKYLHQKLRD